MVLCTDRTKRASPKLRIAQLRAQAALTKDLREKAARFSKPVLKSIDVNLTSLDTMSRNILCRNIK